MKIKKYFFISLLLFLGLSFLLLIKPKDILAADYYVATSGNDSNSGTQTLPFKTIQKGVDVAINPGDVVLVMPGEYRQLSGSTSSALVAIIGKHGNSEDNITLKAYDNNNPPKLMGFGHAVRIIGTSYYTVEGFEITDTYHAAVTTGLADYITIRNNHIHFGFTGFCDGTETAPDPFTGCTVGAIKGRYYTTGTPIIEYDNVQNPGIHMCKTTNSQIINNHIENADEALYVGMAGNVVNSDCYFPAYNDGRLWTESNVISGNIIENAMDEAIELKSDTRNNFVHDNIVRSTRRNWGSTMIEIRGHLNEVNDNIVVGAPAIAIRTHSENPGDPGPDRVEAYTYINNSVLLYKSSYENYIHNNYVYYFSENTPDGVGIVSNYTSSADRVEHNTVVGANQFSQKISEYSSIKTQSIPDTIILNNLMIGTRRVTSDVVRYEYHLISSNGYFPLTSDFNAYYPRLKTNNTSCVIVFGSLGIVCQNNNYYNQSVGYEFNSKFMDANPIKSDDSQCSRTQLLSIPITDLKDRILYCSTPQLGSEINGSASDGTNIGAFQNQPSLTPTPTSTASHKPGDVEGDNDVDIIDFQLLSNTFAKSQGQNGYDERADFVDNNLINIQDFQILAINFGKS